MLHRTILLFFSSLFLGWLLTNTQGCAKDIPNQETNQEASPTDGGTETSNESASETATEPTPEPTPEPVPEVKRFTFPNEEVACQTNESFEKLRSILQGGKNNPTGRGEQGSVYDPCNQRVLLFGGNDYQPQQCSDFGPKRFKDDTWAYVAEYKNWIRLKTEVSPPARGRQVMAFDLSRKLVYMFGGRYRTETSSGNYTMFNDLWAFDVNTDAWKELKTQGDIPTARSNTAMVYDYVKDRLILYGGNSSPSGLSFLPLDDAFTLDLKTLTWTRINAGKRPISRLFHSMVMDSKHNRVLLYGGGGANAFTGPFYNDLWALDLDSLQWTEVWKRSPANPGPDARINSVMIEDAANNRIILFAGHDDTAVGHRNDLWAFDTNQNTWQLKKPGDSGTGVGCSSFCQCSPDFVTVDIQSPERREYHTFVPMQDQARAILFGGKTDCGYIDDTWYLNYENFTWEEINAASQGEACKRTGRDNCKELCY